MANVRVGQLQIVATSRVPAIAIEAFEPLGQVSVLDGHHALAGAELLVVRAEGVDERLLEGAPSLRTIARTGAGLDAIDLDAVTERGIPLLYAPAAGAQAMAEGTLTLIVASLKRLRELHATVTEGRWDERYDYDVLDIAGTTLGVVGFGRIGREVARLAHALGMRIMACDPNPHAIDDVAEEIGVASMSLEGLFADADVITLHCPLSKATRHLVDRELLASTKPGAILVNASRGQIVASEEVLLEALDAGQLSAVALDVFAPEPPAPDSKLLDDPRVICTPHAVGLTRSWNRRVFGSLADDVARLLGGRRPRYIANPEVLEKLDVRD